MQYSDATGLISLEQNDYVQDSKMTFEIMQKQELKINPTKSFLSVSSGIFLYFVVTSKLIHLD